MNVKQFLTEVYKNIPKHEDVKITLEDYVIKFRFGESNYFEVRAPGGLCFTPNTKKDEMFEILHNEVDSAVSTVKEYFNLMEESSELTARDFNMAEHVIDELEDYHISIELHDYFDDRKFGEDQMNEKNGRFVDNGIVYMKDGCSLQQILGHDEIERVEEQMMQGITGM